MLNAANAARLFYPEELPDKYQSAANLKGFTHNAIAYEALSPNRKRQPIFADRDDWGPETLERTAQFSLYGSSHAGIFGAIVGRTSDEAILQLDCLATDFFRGKAYPTHLYFNPYQEDKDVQIDVGSQPADLYDAVSHVFVARGACGRPPLRLVRDSVAVIVQVPASGTVTRDGQRLLVNGVVVDYHSEQSTGNP